MYQQLELELAPDGSVRVWLLSDYSYYLMSTNMVHWASFLLSECFVNFLMQWSICSISWYYFIVISNLITLWLGLAIEPMWFMWLTLVFLSNTEILISDVILRISFSLDQHIDIGKIRISLEHLDTHHWVIIWESSRVVGMTWSR